VGLLQLSKGCPLLLVVLVLVLASSMVSSHELADRIMSSVLRRISSTQWISTDDWLVPNGVPAGLELVCIRSLKSYV
jgi:hypothetical protein